MATATRSTRSTRKPAETPVVEPTPLDNLLSSVKVDRETYADTDALGAIMSGASGAVAACDAIDTGAYADQKTLAAAVKVSEATVTRLVNAGRIMIDNAADVIGHAATVYTAVTGLGVKKANAAVEAGGIAGLLETWEAEKVRRSDASKGARKSASEKSDDTGVTGDQVAEIKTLGDLAVALEPVTVKAARIAEGATLDPVQTAALVSAIDNLIAAATLAGVDLDAVRAEMAA